MVRHDMRGTQRRAFAATPLRHTAACIMMVGLLIAITTPALMHGRAASKAIVLGEQENFRGFGSASSEAGR